MELVLLVQDIVESWLVSKNGGIILTLKDLLKRVSVEDYDKVIVFSDGIGWTNISGEVEISSSVITIFPSKDVFDK